MSTEALTELMKLSTRQRLAIAEQLWLSVADEETMPVPDEHRRIVKDRLERYRTGQAKVLTHAELLRRVHTA